MIKRNDAIFIKEVLRYLLSEWRERMDNTGRSQPSLLNGAPFRKARCAAIFGIEEKLWPCEVFSKQLVLKIFDELLED